MKSVARLLVLAAIVGLFNACSNSRDVVSNSFIQKRKYNSGLFVKHKTKLKEQKLSDAPKEEVACLEEGNYEVIISNLPTMENTQDQPEKSNSQQPLFSEPCNDNKPITKKIIKAKHTLIPTGNATTKSKVNLVNKSSRIPVKPTDSLMDDMMILILILCLIIPPLAVYLLTEDLLKTIIALLLTIFFWLPGVIYAIILWARAN